MYQLTKSFPYIVNRVGVRMGELFVRRIAPYGVTLPMYRVLAAVWQAGDQTLGELAAMTTIEMSSLSRLISEMKRKGLVSRRRAENNGRIVAINLTAKGKALAEELMPIAMHFEEVSLRSLPPDDAAHLKAVLNEVYSNLNAIEPEIEALADQSSGRPKRSVEK